MVDMTDPMFWLGLVVLATLIAGLGAIGWSGYKGYVERKRRMALEAEVADILSREEIQLLRHRDFEAFVKRVNEIRAKKGQAPVESEFLAKIQYNLMYALDESDF
jgi:Tfp pilus assembly protein PilE